MKFKKIGKPIREPDNFEFGKSKNPHFVISMPLHDLSIKKVKHIVKMIENQSFGKTKQDSREIVGHQVAVVIGLNNVYSYDPEIRKAFKEKVKALRNYSEEEALLSKFVAMTILPFFWGYEWVKKKEDPATFPMKKCYLIAKSYFNYLTKRSHRRPLWISDAFNEKHRPAPRAIPYQSIRDRILHSEILKEYMGNVNHKAPKYVLSLDSDFSALKLSNRIGLISRYQRLIEKYKETNGVFPDVISTGYVPPETTTNDMIIAGIKLDRLIRAALPANFIYMPEPNFCFRISDTEDLSALTWKSKQNKDIALESRRLITNGIANEIFDPDHFIFSNHGPVQTEIDNEWFKGKIEEYARIKPSHFKKREVQKTLRTIHQTFAKPRNWAMSVYVGLSVTVSKSKKEGSTPIERIQKLFDPISVKNTRFPDEQINELAIILNLYEKYVKVLQSGSIISSFMKKVKVFKEELSNDETVDEASDSATDNEADNEWTIFLNNQLKAFKKTKKVLKKNYNPEQIKMIVDAAISTGRAIKQFYESELPDLSI